MEIINKKEYCADLFKKYHNEKKSFSDSSIQLEENKLIDVRRELENCLDDCLVYFSNAELEEMEFDNMFSNKFLEKIEQETKKRLLKDLK